jgi:hypothetical protein
MTEGKAATQLIHRRTRDPDFNLLRESHELQPRRLAPWAVLKRCPSPENDKQADENETSWIDLAQESRHSSHNQNQSPSFHSDPHASAESQISSQLFVRS